MDTHERIEMLEDAREHLQQALDLIRQAVDDTPIEDFARAYIIPTLVMAARSEHEYLGSQPANIDELIRAFEGADDED